jgi:dimethylamine monooxygenase subunit A
MSRTGSRFHLGLLPSDPARFFGTWPGDTEQLAERRRRLRESPDEALVWDERAAPALDEFLRHLAVWLPELAEFAAESPDRSRLLMLGEQRVPDIVLMGPLGVDDPRPVVLAGCVRFPSRWRIADKFLLPLTGVHGPVPGLNDALGNTMDRLLHNMPPGKSLARDNWGVCAVPELDQHPDRPIPAVTSPLVRGQVWLRREDQLLWKLPETGAMVFGIRISHQPWERLREDPQYAARVREELATHEPELLKYKNIAHVRDELLQWLT